jgi:hypothetical protein
MIFDSFLTKETLNVSKVFVSCIDNLVIHNFISFMEKLIPIISELQVRSNLPRK